MKLLPLAILAPLALISLTTKAADLTPDAFGVHLVSIHSTKVDGDGDKWNNVNPGIYARWGSIVGGVYYNSFRQTSAYIAYTYPVTSWLDLEAGLVTGYKRAAVGSYNPVTRMGYYRPEHGYALMPMAAASFHWPLTQSLDVRLNVIPGLTEKGGVVAVNLGLEWKLR